jgi:hypothetical protein
VGADGEYIKNAINRAAGLAKPSVLAGLRLWYRKARRVEEYEMDQIREALRLKNEKAARNELHQAKLLLAKARSAA